MPGSVTPTWALLHSHLVSVLMPLPAAPLLMGGLLELNSLGPVSSASQEDMPRHQRMVQDGSVRAQLSDE